jgi:hypothetical protein
MPLPLCWRPGRQAAIPRLTRVLQTMLSIALVLAVPLAAQRQGPRVLPPGPMIDGGKITLSSSVLSVDLLKYSGTVARLTPQADLGLDYTPGDLLKQRSADTFYHLGDLDMRFRTVGTSGWTDVSTAFRRQPVSSISADRTHFTGDLTSSLPQGTPLKVVRTWAVEGGDLVLRFTLTNTSASPIEIGGLGIPMVFNNFMNGRTLDQAYSTCSFYDPYIGEDAGYVQVTRLSGVGPVLLVVPEGHTPLEEWKPILDHRNRQTGEGLLDNDPTPRGTTFEGSYDWMVHSTGYADNEWKGVNEWNPATSKTLAAKESVRYGMRFLVAPDLRHIEATLAAHKHPVAVGIPGYILPQDTDGRLFLRYDSPVRSIVSEPPGSVTIHDDGRNRSGLQAYTLRGKDWGRFRLVLTYADGRVQTIGYRTVKPETEAIADMGRFLFDQQWFDDPQDPFHRSPSVITYDNETEKQVTQDARVWIAGLSDEAGAGSWIAAAMKEYLDPKPEEVAKLESYVDGVLWGHLQNSDGDHKYGVHKSLFFYQPDLVPGFTYDPALHWTSWTSWNRKGADDVGRSYNYPHVVAAYWSLYHVARNTKAIVLRHPWDWYLNQAYETTLAMQTQAPYYTQFGQMEGTVFIRLLEDLKDEGWTDKAQTLEAEMRARADHWKSEKYPFGSEMPWDSTGQEEVYGWSRYFHYDERAEVTLNAILAYDPVIPSWGYNGSARRYWDFIYGGKSKYSRIERQLHHYGSGLNAIPLLEEYRAHPDDLYLLRAGYGGVMGPLSNIDEKGFASAAFHSFPDAMMFDPYTGDYGPNFFGHAVNTGTFLAHDDAMGWICFGGNIAERSGVVHATILDSSRDRLFIAPLGLWITLDAGHLVAVDFDPQKRSVKLHLSAANPYVPIARLRLRQTSDKAKAETWIVANQGTMDAGANLIPLGASETIVSLVETHPKELRK